MEPTTLQIAWFAIVGLLWTGYLVLEGFDFGLGMVMPVLGRSEEDRKKLIAAVGPVWDGNEVWLISAGGMMFAAFPVWYATILSALYLPVVIILLALIARGVAFEFRGKIDSPVWRRRWDTVLAVGSAVPALLWGIAFGNMVRGVDGHALFDAVVTTPDGSGIDLAASALVAHPSWSVLLSALNPYSLVTGLTVVTLFVVHGALYGALRTSGDLRERSRGLARNVAPVLLVVAAVWAVWTQIAYAPVWTWAVVVAAALALGGLVVLTRTPREGSAFGLSSFIVFGAVVMIFASAYPNVLPIIWEGKDVSALFSTTIATASSSAPTLTVMAVVAGIAIPAVMIYQGSVYRLFRHWITDQVPVH